METNPCYVITSLTESKLIMYGSKPNPDQMKDGDLPLVKVTLVGDGTVGKDAAAYRYVNDEFFEDTIYKWGVITF